jgi:hypothetical protein
VGKAISSSGLACSNRNTQKPKISRDRDPAGSGPSGGALRVWGVALDHRVL